MSCPFCNEAPIEWDDHRVQIPRLGINASMPHWRIRLIPETWHHQGEYVFWGPIVYCPTCGKQLPEKG